MFSFVGYMGILFVLSMVKSYGALLAVTARDLILCKIKVIVGLSAYFDAIYLFILIFESHFQ